MLKSSANDSRPLITGAGAQAALDHLIASLVSEPLDLVALTRNPDAQRVPPTFLSRWIEAHLATLDIG